MRTGIMVELGNAQTIEPMRISSYCTIDGCYRENRGGVVGAYCDKHYRNKLRTGNPIAQEKVRDWVSDAAGPECRVCGRSVYQHGVTEFCQEIARQVA